MESHELTQSHGKTSHFYIVVGSGNLCSHTVVVWVSLTPLNIRMGVALLRYISDIERPAISCIRRPVCVVGICKPPCKFPVACWITGNIIPSRLPVSARSPCRDLLFCLSANNIIQQSDIPEIDSQTLIENGISNSSLRSVCDHLVQHRCIADDRKPGGAIGVLEGEFIEGQAAFVA